MRWIDIFSTRHFLFYLGLVLKLCLGTVLASSFLRELFIPFVDYYVESGFQNPYEEFTNVGSVAHFPYPALMLYILAVPKLVLGWITPDNPLFSLFLYRIPLLVADIFIFLVIRSWLKDKYHKRLILFYWLSPVLIYISYVHGQLDVIPIAFVFGSLFYLFNNKHFYAALLLGCALATKTNVAIVLPFFFLFILAKEKPLQTLKFFSVVIGGVILINLPYITNAAFIEMVFQNQEQSKLFDAFLTLNSLSIYLIPACFLLLFVRGLLIRAYNRDIFIMFLGFSFSIILLFIPPMQGWYYWLLPFLAYFYIKEEGRSFLLFAGLQGFYLLYFLVVDSSDYLMVTEPVLGPIEGYQSVYSYLLSRDIQVDHLVNLLFTALQTTLLINCFWIYRKGLDSYSQHKITASPFLIGIGGNSGVGKTTVSDALSNVFTPANTTVLRGDDMHKWQRGHEKWNELTHLDPKANYLHKEINFLKKLKKGKKISRRHYDHGVGEFTPEQTILPKNIIIYEGLHPFYLSAQRRLYDLKIFIRPSFDLMYHWKIIRDHEKRGHTKEKIIQSIKKREEDAHKYIETQLSKADIVVEILPEDEITNIGDEKEKVHVSYHLTLSSDVYIEPLLERLDMLLPSVCITHNYTADEHQKLTLSCSKDCRKLTIPEGLYDFIDGLEDLGIDNPRLPDGLFGVLILILTYYIFEKGEDEKE